MIEIAGVYEIEENPDVSLIEVIVGNSYDSFDISEFTQETEGLERNYWQAPFGDIYLDVTGTKIVGDYFKMPVDKGEVTRLTFFIYFLNQNKPLNTPFGKLSLPVKTLMPERLKQLIRYEDPE